MPHKRQRQPQQTSTASQTNTNTHSLHPHLYTHTHTHTHTRARVRAHTHTCLGLTAHPSQALCHSFCEDTLVAQPTSPVGTTSICQGAGRSEVPWKGRGIFQSLKKRKKENKARLKSSHRQARAPGVLSQARNYRTGSTAKCFIKGNSPPNSWRWAPASCVWLSVSPSPFLSPSPISIHPSPAALHFALRETTDGLPWTTGYP